MEAKVRKKVETSRKRSKHHKKGVRSKEEKKMATTKEKKIEVKDLWCTSCEKEEHTKTAFPKKAFYNICQVVGHSIKDRPYDLKA